MLAMFQKGHKKGGEGGPALEMGLCPFSRKSYKGAQRANPSDTVHVPLMSLWQDVRFPGKGT